MKKLIVFDGVDNTGKTTTITRIKNYLNTKAGKEVCASIRFPPQDVYESDVFRKAIKEPNQFNKIAFIHALLKYVDAGLYLHYYGDCKIILVDRLWFSTMVYQGDEVITPSLVATEYERILSKYKYDVKNIVFLGGILTSQKVEENELKRELDERAKKENYNAKYERVLEQVLAIPQRAQLKCIREIIVHTVDSIETSHVIIDGLCEKYEKMIGEQNEAG